MLLNTVVSSSDSSYNIDVYSLSSFAPQTCPERWLLLEGTLGLASLSSYQAERAARVFCSPLLYIGSDFRHSVSKHRRAPRPWSGPRALAAPHPSSPLARQQFSPSAPRSPSLLTSPPTSPALQRTMVPKALRSLPDPGA